MRLTRAVTPIRLCVANYAKLAALDALAAAYLRLCQAYTTHLCLAAQPDKYAAPCCESALSQRWQRVAIQRAAGIAQPWRANYAPPLKTTGIGWRSTKRSRKATRWSGRTGTRRFSKRW